VLGSAVLESSGLKTKRWLDPEAKEMLLGGKRARSKDPGVPRVQPSPIGLYPDQSSVTGGIRPRTRMGVNGVNQLSAPHGNGLTSHPEEGTSFERPLVPTRQWSISRRRKPIS